MNSPVELLPGPAPLSATVLTPSGRGAVATIALRGELCRLDSSFRAANGKFIAQQSIDRICFGTWGSKPAEDVVLVRTDEHEAELHCHGGRVAVERVFSDVRSVGGEILNAVEFNDGMDDWVNQVCLMRLSYATTRRTAHHLLRQSELLPRAFLELATLSREERCKKIDDMLAWSEFGLHLTTPWKVVLCGSPNVGKSSLINALVGYTRSVVFDQPGTTRDIVSAETAFDGWPVELSDTAGLRITSEELEAEGIHRARQRIKEADVLLIVIDASIGMTAEDRELIQMFPSALLIWNKIDLAERDDGSALPQQAIAVSATQQTGIADVISAIVRKLVPVEPSLDIAFPVSHSQCRKLEADRAGNLPRPE